jgi:hypothetical protein
MKRFAFRFRDAPDAIEVPHGKFAEQHPQLHKLQQHLEASARAAAESGDPAQAKALADRAFAGFLARSLKHFGKDYVERMEAAVEKIYESRENMATQLEGVLEGGLPDFDVIRKSFDDIDAAFDAMIKPEEAKPPPLESVRGSGANPKGVPKDLTDFLDAKGTTKKSSDVLREANKHAATELAAVLEVTQWEGATDIKQAKLNAKERAKAGGKIDALVAKLREKGFSDEQIRDLRQAIDEWSMPGEMRQAVDAGIVALSGEQLPNVGVLQDVLGKSARLRELFRVDPARLRKLWLDFNGKTRKISFGLYVWCRMHHARGSLGEWTAAFELGESGILVFLKGPKHEITTPGTDLVAFDINTGQIYMIDNKATLRATIYYKVTALVENFRKNLGDDARDIFKEVAEEHGAVNPAMASLQTRMANAEAKIAAVEMALGPLSHEGRQQALRDNVDVTLPSGERMPVQQAIDNILQEHGISRTVTNAGGVLERISANLERMGLEFENLNEILGEGEE